MGNDGELIARLGLTLLLCFCIGLEREIHQKSAGLRTHTLVGLGAAVAMMVSKYGFADLSSDPSFRLDPARVAAQIVSGIGFIGAGIIFVRRGSVRGLTTAAVVWVTAMIGMAAGAGMYVLAIAATVGHFIVIMGYPVLTRRIPGSKWSPISVRVTYHDGQGVLRQLLSTITGAGFSVSDMRVGRAPTSAEVVVVELEVLGKGSWVELASTLEPVSGVVSVETIGDDEAP
jgi:putative Mg2+ transporter-C (MgtC) family protein